MWYFPFFMGFSRRSWREWNQTYHSKLDKVTSLNFWIRTIKFPDNLKALKCNKYKLKTIIYYRAEPTLALDNEIILRRYVTETVKHRDTIKQRNKVNPYRQKNNTSFCYLTSSYCMSLKSKTQVLRPGRQSGGCS